MPKRFALLVILSLFFANFSIHDVKAEGEFSFDKFPYKEMQIQLMPEYDYPENWPEDQPSLLTGYYGTITNKTGSDYKGEIEFPVPAKDKNFEVYLVAEFPSDTEPEVQRPFKVNKEKGVVTWTPAEPIKKGKDYRFVVEYYTNPFEASDSKKFTYNYVSPADAEKLDLIVIAPLKGTDFKIDPAAAKTSESDYGEKLYYYQYTNVKKNTAFDLSISYTKKDNKSTLASLSEEAPPKDENHSGVSGGTATDQVLNNASSDKGTGNNTSSPIIGIGGAVVIGISVIIAGVFVYLGLKGNTRSRKTIVAKQKKPERKAVASKPDVKKSKTDLTEQKKKLRTLLLSGKIDEQTYEDEMKKLG